MSHSDNAPQIATISAAKAAAVYAGMLLSFIILIELVGAVSWIPGATLIVVYFSYGFILNRIVLRGLIEFHPVYATLENVAATKQRAFLFWPLFYAVLLFRLGVNKFL